MSRVRSNRVCFTLNNYDFDDIRKIEEITESSQDIIYLCAGLEEGQSGTPHIQGFIHINKNARECGIKFWQQYFGFSQKAHFANAKGTDEQNEKYCSKDGPFFSFGTPTEPEDKFRKIYETAKEDLDAAIALDFEFGMRCYNQLKTIHETHQGANFDIDITLNDWQNQVLQKLDIQTDRQVLFVVDKEGGKGKSTLCKWIMANKTAWACQGKDTR